MIKGEGEKVRKLEVKETAEVKETKEFNETEEFDETEDGKAVLCCVCLFWFT